MYQKVTMPFEDSEVLAKVAVKAIDSWIDEGIIDFQPEDEN